MACVSSQLPDDPPAKPNVLAVLVRYRFAFATRCSKCSRCSSLPARRLRALLLALPTPFCDGLPHTSLASKQNRGPSSHNRSRIATHRTAVPTPYLPYLPYLVYQTFCCPARSHPQLQLLEQQKESPSPHTCGIVCQLSSFRFSILRCARFCQHFTLLSWYQLCFASSGTVTCSLMHACKLPTLRSL